MSTYLLNTSSGRDARAVMATRSDLTDHILTLEVGDRVDNLVPTDIGRLEFNSGNVTLDLSAVEVDTLRDTRFRIIATKPASRGTYFDTPGSKVVFITGSINYFDVS